METAKHLRFILEYYFIFARFSENNAYLCTRFLFYNSMYKPIFLQREIIVFRHFQRKGYSLFACLGREVLISVLSVATLSATKAAGISDETWRVDSTKAVSEVWLDDVAVTGSRAPLTKSQAARMVTVLSREDIAQAPVQSINDLLKMAVGVDIRQRGALGAQTDISIRGGTQEQIMILLNGINICDPQTGHNALDLPCDLSDIVRIEVLEGPAGRVYGTSSLVGAINIVTSAQCTPDEGSDPGTPRRDISLALEGGSFGYARFGAGMKMGDSDDPLHLAISAGTTRSDGYSRSAEGHLNTDFNALKAFLHGNYDNDRLRAAWHLGMSNRQWGSGTFYATPRWQADEQYEKTRKVFSAVTVENKKGFVHFQPAFYWNHNYDNYQGYRDRPDIMKFNYNRTNVFGWKLNGYFDWTFGRTAFGAEVRLEDLVSGNLGEPLSEPIHISGTDRDYTLGISRTNLSAFLEHNILLDRLTISAGFVAAKSSKSDMRLTVYPGIDVSYRIGNNAKVFASFNSSLRLPSFTEMYYKLQGYAADPHLKPEEMQAVEVGAQYASPLLQTKVTAYYHHGKNMIDWIMDTNIQDWNVWQSVNHTRLNAYGIEASVTADLSQLRQQPSALPTLHLSYSYITQDKDLEPGIVSQYALEYLRHKLVASAQSNLWRQLSLRVDLRWQDRVGAYTTFDGDIRDYRPYALMDARLQWKAPRYTVYAEVNNLLDNRSYVDFGNVAQPGAWFTIGARYTFRL